MPGMAGIVPSMAGLVPRVVGLVPRVVVMAPRRGPRVGLVPRIGLGPTVVEQVPKAEGQLPGAAGRPPLRCPTYPGLAPTVVR